jgi:hypothetical protein
MHCCLKRVPAQEIISNPDIELQKKLIADALVVGIILEQDHERYALIHFGRGP